LSYTSEYKELGIRRERIEKSGFANPKNLSSSRVCQSLLNDARSLFCSGWYDSVKCPLRFALHHLPDQISKGTRSDICPIHKSHLAMLLVPRFQVFVSRPVMTIDTYGGYLVDHRLGLCAITRHPAWCRESGRSLLAGLATYTIPLTYSFS
jgi:hypothetical protein